MAIGFYFVFKQSSFFLNGPAFIPPPLLMAWALVDELFLRHP